MEKDSVHYVDVLHQKTHLTVMVHMQNLVSKQKHLKSKSVIRFTELEEKLDIVRIVQLKQILFYK